MLQKTFLFVLLLWAPSAFSQQTPGTVTAWVIGDLDADGVQEALLEKGGRLFAVRRDRTVLFRTVRLAARQEQRKSIAVADLDGDGAADIGYRACSKRGGRMLALNANGKRLKRPARLGVGACALAAKKTRMLLFPSYTDFWVWWSDPDDDDCGHCSDGGNRAPEINSIPDQRVAAGKELRFTIEASDPDHDTMYLAWASAAPRGATLNLSSGEFYWKPGDAQVGDYGLEFRVRDTRGARDSETVRIAVTPRINRAPVVTPIADRTVLIGEQVGFTIDASDPDDDVLKLAASNLPRGAFLDKHTGEFAWTPKARDVGAHPITFVITDPYGGSASATVTVTVGSPGNHPPVMPTIGDMSASVGVTLHFLITATDPDNDPMTLSAAGVPSGAVLNDRAGDFSWKPAVGQEGSHQVTFAVSDIYGATVSETITIMVGGPNQPPVVAPIGDKTVAAGSELRFTIQASDPDDDVMYLTWENAPPGAQLDLTTGEFYWRPTAGQAGSGRVTFSVTDTINAAVSQTITITVTDSNRPPVVAPIGDKTVKAGASLQFQVQAQDPDEDVMYLSVDGLPPGARIDLSTGDFDWTPAASQVGTHSIAFNVSDERSPAVSEAITVTVVP